MGWRGRTWVFVAALVAAAAAYAEFTIPTTSGHPIKLTESTTNNVEPSPKQVRYEMFLDPPAKGAGDVETASIYIDVQPNGDQLNGIYCDISNQADTLGTCLKIIHQGSGDASYIAIFGANGVGMETASFEDGSRGAISTIQYDTDDGALGSLAAHQVSDSVLFNGVWGYDGTGGSVQTANLAMYLADRSLGNSFTARVQDETQSVPAGGPSNAGVVAGTCEFRVIDWAGNVLWCATNGGGNILNATAATASSTAEHSPTFRLNGNHWDGAASDQVTGIIQHVVLDNTGNWSGFNFSIASENIMRMVNSTVNHLDLFGTTYITGLDMQNSAWGSYTTTFTNASLSAGVLTVTHSLNSQYVQCSVYDGSAVKKTIDTHTGTSASVATLDLTSHGTLTGTWAVRCSK